MYCIYAVLLAAVLYMLCVPLFLVALLKVDAPPPFLYCPMLLPVPVPECFEVLCSFSSPFVGPVSNSSWQLPYFLFLQFSSRPAFVLTCSCSWTLCVPCLSCMVPDCSDKVPNRCSCFLLFRTGRQMDLIVSLRNLTALLSVPQLVEEKSRP